MEAAGLEDHVATLRSRINLRAKSIDMWHRIQARDDCSDSDSNDTCEKPASGTNMTLPIALGVW